MLSRLARVSSSTPRLSQISLILLTLGFCLPLTYRDHVPDWMPASSQNLRALFGAYSFSKARSARLSATSRMVTTVSVLPPM